MVGGLLVPGLAFGCLLPWCPGSGLVCFLVPASLRHARDLPWFRGACRSLPASYRYLPVRCFYLGARLHPASLAGESDGVFRPHPVRGVRVVTVQRAFPGSSFGRLLVPSRQVRSDRQSLYLFSAAMAGFRIFCVSKFAVCTTASFAPLRFASRSSRCIWFETMLSMVGGTHLGARVRLSNLAGRYYFVPRRRRRCTLRLFGRRLISVRSLISSW